MCGCQTLLPDRFHSPYVLLTVTTYYKPMGDLPYISSEQRGGLIIHTELIYEYTIKRPIPIYKNRAEEGGGLIIHHGRTTCIR